MENDHSASLQEKKMQAKVTSEWNFIYSAHKMNTFSCSHIGAKTFKETVWNTEDLKVPKELW